MSLLFNGQQHILLQHKMQQHIAMSAAAVVSPHLPQSARLEGMEGECKGGSSLLSLNTGSSSPVESTTASVSGAKMDGTPSTPDPDTIKMFVGQIPRNWNEMQCRELFEQYGPVYQLNILRDKQTQQSKGCCFVTYYHRRDSISAQCELHNVRTLAGMHHPIQMKPADSENRNERKLFIGMISKKMMEEEVKTLFAPFGQIEDCTVLRDSDNRSKGCAFVTFMSRANAQTAIKHMHHSQTMEGCSTQMVVKFADTQKDKEAKLAQGSGGGGGVKTSTSSSVSPLLTTNTVNPLLQPGMAGANLLGQLLQGALLQNPQLMGAAAASGQQNVLSLLGNAVLQPSLIAQQQAMLQQQRMIEFQQMLQGQQAVKFDGMIRSEGGMDSHILAAQQNPHAAALILQQQMLQQQQAAVAAAASSTSPAPGQYSYQPTSPKDVGLFQAQQQLLGAPAVTAYDPTYASQLQAFGLAGLVPQVSLAGTAVGQNGGTPIVGNGQSKGPDGSNLFIYHLPQDFSDSDLYNTFSPFGTVLSAKVFIDKQTNLSKCFGFVSYDNAASAANAISGMNGFQIGSKRLKVQLKNARSHPYALGVS